MNLEACLPADLRGPATTITPIAAGLSGAGVYRVQAAERVFVLKVAHPDQPLGFWRHRVQLQQHAASAGVAPAVVHVDEATRSVLSVFVADQSFPALYGNPGTRDAAIALAGRTIRRVHELPLSTEGPSKAPREFISGVRSQLADFPLPGFAADAVRRTLNDDPPTLERPLVLSHNDVNPTNLAYDGARLLLVDWDTAGPNDPFYDLAAIALFFRMDDATSARLVSAYDDAPAAALPARFGYNRRLVGVLCGAVFLNLARQSGHAGAAGDETLAQTPSLVDFYQRLRTGAVDIKTADGQWAFGLALIKEIAAT